MEDTLKLIKKTIKKIRPYINSDGGDLEFVKFEDGIVYIRLLGACVGCSSADTTVKGGSKLHNELGIYDMAGNVQELCFDWYDTDYSNVPTNVNPTGVATGTSKVKRGGDLASLYLLYETSFRWHYVSVTSRQELTGLRIVINM